VWIEIERENLAQNFPWRIKKFWIVLYTVNLHTALCGNCEVTMGPTILRVFCKKFCTVKWKSNKLTSRGGGVTKCSETNLTVQRTKLRKAGLGSSRTSVCLGKCERHDNISQLPLCYLIHLKTQVAKRSLRYCAYSLQLIFSLGTRFLGRLSKTLVLSAVVVHFTCG
jgi:hypothetical protein